jgi:glycosyltransferase involved in cell wall biosynthesis
LPPLPEVANRRTGSSWHLSGGFSGDFGRILVGAGSERKVSRDVAFSSFLFACASRTVREEKTIQAAHDRFARAPEKSNKSARFAQIASIKKTVNLFLNTNVMNIVVSLLNFRPGDIGGTETYLRRLIPRLAESVGDHELTLLIDRQQDDHYLFTGIARSVVDMTSARILFERGLEAVSPYRCKAVESALNRLQPDVVFFPQQSIFPKCTAWPSVLVVHDLYHVHLPQFLSPLQRFVRNRVYGPSIHQADRIIAISQVTKDAIVEHYGIKPERVFVVPHGAEHPTRQPAPNHPPFARPYLYYPAISLPHKNHAVLFESIAKLSAAGRFDYELILSGKQTKHWKTLQQQIRRLGIEHIVRHLGFIPYEQVQRLYRGAECVLFPTKFEGFGLPVTEAFEARKKIIVTRLPIFRELGVPDEFQIDFGDPEQLEAAIRLPGVTSLRAPRTWRETARATLGVLVNEASIAIRNVLPMAVGGPYALAATAPAVEVA